MTDKPELPSIDYVLTRRGVALESWIEEKGISTPWDLNRVCEALKDSYSFPEEWKRRAMLVAMDRMVQVPISIGGGTSLSGSPSGLPLVADAGAPLMTEDVPSPSDEPTKPAKGSKTARRGGKSPQVSEETPEGFSGNAKEELDPEGNLPLALPDDV